MQFSTLLLPLLSLAATQASPIIAEDHVISARATANTFQITDFYDSGVPHSVTAYVSFTVTNPVTRLSAKCYASQSIQPTIATTPFPTKCDKPGVAFGFQYYAGLGYALTVLHKRNYDQVADMGIIWVGNDVQTRVNPANPNGNVQYINHTTAFEIPYSSYTQLKKPTTPS
ncbi:hypothetical protein H072_4841 [Dactylellina haptotyla CBS 200.50]|uniref:Carboxylic ester hydrolase n=1 Tax=Dactylellina haptotyla (strain CBS 200.50) TaxID=1284197 RepID=S8AJI5_DACHA|nr:hypothetical protein H072_4841 [Dactylellina haptotyla CBS 200.50]